jgi:hypothetical protein
MAETTPGRRGSLVTMRRAGLALAGTVAAGLAVLGGTAASAAPAQPGTTGMAMAGRGWASHVGTTKGWYAGRTVTFRYTRNFFCRTPPASRASSRCEAGVNYTQTPAPGFDPLYVVVPLGFTPPRSTLQCPVAGRCIDHPSTIDLTSVLGRGTGNALLPPHSHIVGTANGGQYEWWNVYVVGVSSRTAWNQIVAGRSAATLQRLQRTRHSGVTGNIGSNLFLFFAVQKW